MYIQTRKSKANNEKILILMFVNVANLFQFFSVKFNL